MCLKPWFKQDIEQILPCGGCIGCRLDKMSLWSGRASSEIKKGRNAFVTLTYDDYHLPFNDKNFVAPTLRKVHLQDYLNKLHTMVRKRVMPYGCRADFKYYVVGEYGDTFRRPHYHALFFGLDFHDFSKFFSDTWHYGSVKSLPCCSATVRYVLDYMTKNINGRLAVEQYDNLGIERPFSSNSKGFGFDYFYNHRDDINSYGMIKNGSRYIPVPTYYKNMFQKHDYDSVLHRDCFYMDLLKDELSRIRRLKFDTLQDYQDYSRKCLNQKYISDYNNRGKVLDSQYILHDFSCDGVVLQDFLIDSID